MNGAGKLASFHVSWTIIVFGDNELKCFKCSDYKARNSFQHQPGRPLPGALQKKPGGWEDKGGRRRRRWKGCGSTLQLDPPKDSWGQTHIWGLSI